MDDRKPATGEVKIKVTTSDDKETENGKISEAGQEGDQGTKS